MSGNMQFSETACEILDIFRETRRKPGARMIIDTLKAGLGTDPAVAAAISELHEFGLVEAPDGETVELTDRGYDMVQRGDYRQ